MIAKVLPVFSQIYAELGSELTGTAAVLMKLSEYINRYLLVIIAFMLFAALVLFIFFKTRFGKKLLMKTALSMSIASSLSTSLKKYWSAAVPPKMSRR